MNDPFDALRARPGDPPGEADLPDPAFRRALLAEVRRLATAERDGTVGGTSGATRRSTGDTSHPDPTELVPMPTSPTPRTRLLVVAACILVALVGAVTVIAVARDDDSPPTVDRPTPTTVETVPGTVGTTVPLPTSSTTSPTAPPSTAAPSTAPPTTSSGATQGVALAPVDDGLLAFEGGDIVGEIAAGFGSVWVGTTEGLIEIDSATFGATWYRGLAGGRYVATGFGSVWVADGDAGTVTRVDPETKAVLATIGVPGPFGIAVRTDTVDVTQFSTGTVTRIDPSTDTVAGVVEVVTPGTNGPRQPAVVDDELWFAVPNVNKVARVDAADVVTLIDVPGLVGRGVPVVTDSAVWISAGADPLTRVDRTTGVAQMVEVPDELRSDGTVAGFELEGTVWYATTGAVVAIDGSGAVLGSVPRRGDLVRDAVVAAGSVWIVSETAPSIERIPIETFTDALGG